jgi:hypothetical protein
MKRALIMIFLLVGLAIPPDPVKTFELDEPIVMGVGYLTDVNYLCSYICQQREYDPDYCKEACGDLNAYDAEKSTYSTEK